MNYLQNWLQEMHQAIVVKRWWPQRLGCLRMQWIGLFIATLLLSMSCQWLDSADASTTIHPPLSTKGSQILDAKGQPVLLRGVNWFGIESEVHVPHGLWARDYKDMLAQIKSQGYNVIRLPYSVQALRSSKISGVDFSIGSNRELQGKTPIEVMDQVIQEADRQGLLILLDSHRLNDERIPELWYGDGFTEADWLNTWTLLAKRYRNQRNVIGADLKNEPHGRASWGTNDPKTDWRLAAERAGNAILAINPDWLIVVEGVENNVPGQTLKIHWMGANLEGVKKFPVRLSRANKLVYSPHEYGTGVYNQPWFAEADFPKNLADRWEIGWNYIATQKIAPILIGEFGGRQVDTQSKEGIWQRQLVEFIQKQGLSFTYWSWNPNSGDTGGILLDDWRTIDQPKQQLLNSLLPAPGLPKTASSHGN
ncbi:MAG TPA: glycoside hydrolase family 5 protein [Microcoleaceae cyanobacterium]